MIVLIYAVAIIAIVAILVGLVGSPALGARQIRLPEQAQPSKKMKAHSFLGSVFPFTRKFLELTKLDIKIKNRLDAAHIAFSPAAFFNLKLLIIIAVIGLGFLATGKLEPVGVVVALAAGYVFPDVWLSRKISQRKYQIARLLPETVDLLGLCVEAGLDFTTAVKWIVEKVPRNPMVDELMSVFEEIKWGKPRVQALRDMSRRLNVPEVSSFVQALVQAERMGTPVAEAFAILSEDTRLQRFHRGERYAMQAPIKILVPLIFCILPVIAIIIGGPILLQFTQGGLLKGLGG